MPLRQHLVGLDASLGEHGPAPSGLRLHVFPLALEQPELSALDGVGQAAPAQEDRLEQRLRERAALVRHGHRNAELLADARRLAQDDLEHRAVHRVVGAVEERGAHRRARLTESIDAALALFVARRVPGEVVVNDGVEVLLEVDALRQAVGSDQDSGALSRADPRHPLLALFRGHLAGHGVDGVAGNALQVLAEVTGNVVGGRDEAAEHHDVEPLRDQLGDVRRSGLELRIAALAREPLRLPDQPRQRRTVATGRGLHVVRNERVDVAVEDAIQKVFAGLVAQVLAGTGAQGQHGRNGARAAAPQQRQRPPEVETLPLLVTGVRLDDLGAVVEDIVEERLPGAAELVGELLRLSAREDVAIVPLRDVGPPSLDEVVREAFAETLALPAGGFRQALEVRGKQAEQPVEGSVVAAVRSGGEHDEVSRCAGRQAPKQLVPLMPALAGRGARVGLVDDHEVGARLEEVVSPLPGLHVVETDDRVRVHREDAHTRRDALLQPPRGPGGDGCGADVEADFQLSCPLVHEMGRAEDDGAIDVPAVEEFAGDEQGLDRLSYADVVRDEEAHRVELERHEQRHELVRAGFDRDLANAPEGAGAPSQREQQRVAKQ